MNNQVYYEVSNKSLDITYQILDILIAVLFFILIFGLIYKGLSFIIRTIGLIIKTILDCIIPEKENYDSNEDDLSENTRSSRSACYAKSDSNNYISIRHNDTKQPDNKPKFQIESSKQKTFEDMMNDK